MHGHMNIKLNCYDSQLLSGWVLLTGTVILWTVITFVNILSFLKAGSSSL